MRNKQSIASFVLATAGVGALVASLAIAQPAGDSQPEMQLPPGWTDADMMACMQAGTPGEQHEYLMEAVGEWSGQTKMWMAPGMEPMTTESTCTITPFMDGRYTKTEWSGEMPGMGTFNGFGINGYDNVGQKYVAMWVDNHSTGIMNGTGERSADGKTMTWRFNYMCPVTQKPATMRQVETVAGPDRRKMEMFGKDPKSGKEFKMMEITFNRNS